jgi:hypothetical protein
MSVPTAGGAVAEPVRVRRLTDQEGQKPQQIVRRGSTNSVRHHPPHQARPALHPLVTAQTRRLPAQSPRPDHLHRPRGNLTGNTLVALKSVRAARPDGAPVYVILGKLSAPRRRRHPPLGAEEQGRVLRARGHVALDTDEDGFSRWIDRAKGEVVVDPPYPVPGGWLDRYGWAIVRERVETLVEESRFRHRLATRTTNTFGQHPEELAAALKWNPRMRALYESHGATIIDASKPMTEVVDSVIDAVQGLTGLTR